MTDKKLNKAQQEAVEYNNGPLLIVAGAGTGKTTVITEKIAYLIANKLAKPEEILALTFTDKAAEEMQTRVDAVLALGYADTQISTFHTFCEHLLQRYALDAGLNSAFKLMNGTGSWLLIHDHLDEFELDYYRPLGNPIKHIHQLANHFSKCKDELVSPADYLRYAEGIQHDNGEDNIQEKNRLTEIAMSYHRYNQLLLDSNALDFGDLIFYSVELLRNRRNIKSLLQARYKYILVDEFQDVNWAQYTLVKLLAEKGNLTVVGDDDQSVYAFRGASVSNILRFKDDFPNTKEVVLNENYRSGPEILDLAYRAIQFNNPDRLEVKLGVDKKLQARADIKSEVSRLPGDTGDDEVRMVIQKIISLKNNDRESKWSDFAILARANSHVEPFVNALQKAGIPFEFLSSTGLYKQPIVLDCFNFFKAVDHYHESNAVFRLLRLPHLNFSDADLFLFTAAAKKKTVSYYEGLNQATEWGLSEAGIAVCANVRGLIDAGALNARTEKPTTVLYNFLESSGYLAYLAHEENVGNRSMIQQIRQLRKFFDFVSEFETAALDAHVKHFVNYFAAVIQSGNEGGLAAPDTYEDALNILTVHSAKGLEFKYVFIVNLVEERFPLRNRDDGIEIPLPLIHEQLPEGDIHYQEERRLFYVGATRAKEKLFLSSADNYGGVKKRKISRFLAETFADIIPPSAGKSVNKSLDSLSSSVRPAMVVQDMANPPVAAVTPSSFSFSVIKAYESCPYQYKLAHILKIPTRKNASFSFGESMHLAMQKFYARIQELNSVSQESLFLADNSSESPDPVAGARGIRAPALEDLYKIYEECWSGNWYKSKRQREEYHDKGRRIVKEFYDTHENHWTVPVVLEGWFRIKIDDNIIQGRIDRVDRLPDKSLEIIDYKTGKSKESVKGSDKDQLLLYQLAVESLPEYSHLGSVGKLTYFYLNDNLETSFVGTAKELNKLKDGLIETIAKIKTGDFVATPGKHVCPNCDFRDICEFRII
ncbi:MAG: ATP-dependent DNA helicase [Patescibacteria group bacterium]